MKKVAIIGSKGFIGKHLDWYLRTKMNIVADCYDIHRIDEPNYQMVDMSSKESVERINLNVDYIFYMVGMTGTKIGFYAYEDFLDINELSLLNLLDVISKSRYRPKVVFPSSRLVYKGLDKALKEDDAYDTKTVYAVNKLACEGYLKAYGNYFDIPYTIFRLCVPYGNMLDNDYSFGTIGFFIKMAKEGKNITLYGDGTMKRTFTHFEDLCYQMIYGTFNPKSDNMVFNVGGETSSLDNVAYLIAKKYGVEVVHVPWPKDDLRIESGHTYFDDMRIQNLLGGYSYKHSLNEIEIQKI